MKTTTPEKFIIETEGNDIKTLKSAFKKLLEPFNKPGFARHSNMTDAERDILKKIG